MKFEAQLSANAPRMTLLNFDMSNIHWALKICFRTKRALFTPQCRDGALKRNSYLKGLKDARSNIFHWPSSLSQIFLVNRELAAVMEPGQGKENYAIVHNFKDA